MNGDDEACSADAAMARIDAGVKRSWLATWEEGSDDDDDSEGEGGGSRLCSVCTGRAQAWTRRARSALSAMHGGATAVRGAECAEAVALAVSLKLGPYSTLGIVPTLALPRRACSRSTGGARRSTRERTGTRAPRLWVHSCCARART